MALTEIEYGSLASSAVMNNNFQYLDNRISTLANTVNTNQAGIISNLASINNSVTNINDEINLQISRVDSTLNSTISKFSDNGLYVTTYINGSSWYREYFLNEAKTQRIWLEQCLAKNYSQGDFTVNFLRTYSDTNYSVCFGISSSNQTDADAGISYYALHKNVGSMNVRHITRNWHDTNAIIYCHTFGC